MAFHEVQFPVNISYSSSGGPTRRTEIITLDSGFEQRNTSWAESRHRYNVAYGIKTYDDIHALKAFWEARNGPLHGFRYKDWSDFKSCAPQTTLTPTDQTLGTGDGTQTTFQLVKVYTSGLHTYTRTIKKPVAGTVRVSKNNVEALSGWTVDTATGIITFSVAPTSGHVVKAGFEYDIPVRFDEDRIEINLEAFKHGSLSPIMLTEIRV